MKKLPGNLYKSKGRWYWKIKLPGEEKRTTVALKPPGAKFATKEKGVAVEIARTIYKKALRSETAQDGDNLPNLVSKYFDFCEDYYRHSREAQRVSYALNYMLENCEEAHPEDFGPLQLIKLREKMITKGLARKTINDRIGCIKRMFKWAASRQYVPAMTYYALTSVEGLRAGRSEAKETKPVEPVPEGNVYAILPYLSDIVADMVQLQLLTGMRSTELCTMKPCYISTKGKIWVYTPASHKTAYRGHSRQIAIGPKAQEILKKYLKRKLDEYCFAPAEATGEKRKYKPCYNKDTYRRAIARGIEKHNEDEDNKTKIPHWHPHQLRHTAGTKVRRELGRDAARAFLGHKNPQITDDYAKVQDLNIANKAAAKLG